MPGLGLSLAVFPSATAAAVEDYMWELSGGQLQALNIGYDFNDTWDLDTNSDIMPALVPKEEGYYEVDANGDIQPK
tara:strand:- start:4 stop:231 length:228 start_codon:yes stop_codon:yes gene_type:complete